MKRAHSASLTLTLCLLASWLISTTHAQDVITGEAFVNDISTEITDDGLVVTLSGELPDPCTEITGVDVEQDGNTITIVVATERDADLMCAAVLEPYETSVTITGLDAGTYTIEAGGETATIAIDTPISAQAQAAPECPEPDDDDEVIAFRDDTTELCGLLPANTLVLDDDERADLVFAADEDVTTDVAPIYLFIAEAGGRTLEGMRAQNSSRNTDMSTASIGDEAALMVVNTSLTASNRQMFIIHNDAIYRFIQSTRDRSEASDTLWDTLFDNLIFTPVDE